LNFCPSRFAGRDLASNQHEACQENGTNDKGEYSANEVGHAAIEDSIHKDAHRKGRSEAREQNQRFCQKRNHINRL
jgi:hypothetical protein